MKRSRFTYIGGGVLKRKQRKGALQQALSQNKNFFLFVAGGCGILHPLPEISTALDTQGTGEQGGIQKKRSIRVCV